MTVRDVGDGYPIEYQSRDPDGVLTAATVVLTVTDPSGNAATPTPTNPSTGVYRHTIDLDEAGLWRWTWTVTGAVQDVAYGHVTAAATAPTLYVDLDTLKLALAGRAAGSTTSLAMDVGRDALLSSAIASASRSIDAYTGRRYWADTAATARVYPLRGRVVCDQDGERLMVDDIASTTGLTVEVGVAGSTTWTSVGSSGWETGPANALAKLEPVTDLLRVNARWHTSSITRVRVTARWGWPAVPDVVTQACLLQAARLYRRKDSPEGVVGNAEWGTVRLSRIDPDVQALIAHLVVPAVG
ncbi:hypothetical protein QTQ03_25310 [Micromonospora sp. WMMA1363]|uniref:hypothetical protein n=1 Tax=Micromonospora sp. WMMA1363 TaxID=3053985 RepID=UPI00259C841F|nr:hypothetical protein [Micromonospora sp. WMMA1363]MDM4722754.1 hypothetical protein [Micromonospora sp. WMMA1363]